MRGTVGGGGRLFPAAMLNNWGGAPGRQAITTYEKKALKITKQAELVYNCNVIRY
jgi:hypothetical protein